MKTQCWANPSVLDLIGTNNSPGGADAAEQGGTL